MPHRHSDKPRPFKAWYQELKRLAKKRDIRIDSNDEGMWREYWEDGYTPEEAISTEEPIYE